MSEPTETIEAVEVVYEVTIYVPDDGSGIPTEEEIQRAIFQGVPGADSYGMKAIEVQRA